MPSQKSTKQSKSTKPANNSAASPISKAAAVRAALGRGIEKPAEAVKFIKAEYGLDVPRHRFSVYKSAHRKREAIKRLKLKKVRPASELLAPPTKRHGGHEKDVLIAAETIKSLVEQHGVDRVKRLVNLLG